MQERRGAGNSVVEVFRSTLYGALAGVAVGGWRLKPPTPQLERGGVLSVQPVALKF